MAAGTIIGLLTLLTNLGILGGKAAAKSGEDKKSNSQSLRMQVEEKNLLEEQRAKDKQQAIARAIGSKVGTMPTYSDPKLEPYKQKDLSGYDISRGVVGEVGNLAAGAFDGSNNADETQLAGAEDAAKAFPGGGVGAAPLEDPNNALAKTLYPDNSKYDRYGAYLSKRRA